ncbi:NAD(P)H-dependent oxidoreductase [Pedobacter hiemivivus]|uniref:NAD(P)H-dependent oxidoreductase n=1 Tax=Pedobacter hiemivivus TaxID=2530454 RepID=A0A4U1G3F4_9SPHI|nr:nitroreductase family protein [Pedobacter hiemivivus]TKC57110.1 NAD(P)H-dependent oxidoreductase [Pedobacter hiemivivus]
MEIIKALEWRYATKKMTGRIVPEAQVGHILKATHLAPSGIGLQPYEVIVISNQYLKEVILPVAMNQAQVMESSHLLVFAVWEEYSHERIDRVFERLDAERGLVHPNAERQRNFAKQFFGQMNLEENFHHAAKQANIADVNGRINLSAFML